MIRYVVWFVFINAVILGLVMFFVIRPQVNAYGIQRDSLRIAEMQYDLMQGHKRDFESNLQIIEELGREALPLRAELPIILAEINQLAIENNLDMLMFLASDSIGYHIGDGLYIFETHLRAEYAGGIEDIFNFFEGMPEVAYVANVVMEVVDGYSARVLVELYIFMK